MARSGTAALVGLGLAVSACAGAAEAPPGLGRPVASGPIRTFAASPDGSALAFFQFPGTGIALGMAILPLVLLWYLNTAEVKEANGKQLLAA